MTNRKTNSSHHTLLLGVMGDPIGHSKSPAMHNIALEASGIPGMYVPLHVKPEHLAEAVAGTKALGFSGFNVTIPHKVEMMKLMDELDESAICCGAVNTVVIKDGKLKGYNTDGIGYVRSLKEELNSELSGKHITILGAGGAARGVVYALLREEPASVTIINRTLDKAEQLAQEFSHDTLQVQSGSYDTLDKVLPQTDILINTTSIGMSPNSDDTPLEQRQIPEGIVVSDLIYNPLETRLLREAKSRGCTVIGGLGMFVYQGAYAYEYWTGEPAPISVMRSALLEAMNHQKE
ncbi:shikimate dehydrogenase [Paenibacillus kyungheensis]|uniref:Shikimate dehydrogenase (NADP(+)) n=1 Tax=Paenibacillus kyungheensis TaxID=1452732 RepID=A0AAX3LYX0_9BACL|nr:shikimate dehydrogenase [Paenibacillus kyungheensis]WCT54661.1 shikimate dehydrogenase [Paenibacillus kyungheensis]